MYVTIVLDGVGIGAQPDAHLYGDEDADTLGHVCTAARPSLPHLASLGLGRIAHLTGVEPVRDPLAAFGKMQEASAGKDSTTGHWELAGIHLDEPFPTYPGGFPEEIVRRFFEATGCDGVLGNRVASGTAIIQELGEEHERTGFPIVYTSVDSVFQIAAHKDVMPLDRLYDVCRRTREQVCVGEHDVGRVIARPFVGSPGSYERVSGERKDFSRVPPDVPVQQVLQQTGIRTVAIGKIGDLFAGVGFDESLKTSSNGEGVDVTLQRMHTESAGTFIWTNLVDFDQEYGHRNDPVGFARALEAFDAAVPSLLEALPSGGRLVVTADHGNDPTTPGTDHCREYVPLLVYDASASRDLGTRASFCDHAASVADYFDVAFDVALRVDARPF